MDYRLKTPLRIDPFGTRLIDLKPLEYDLSPSGRLGALQEHKALFDERYLLRYQLLQAEIISKDLYENLLLQSLVPAFDKIPTKRVFPICLYVPEVPPNVEVGLDSALDAVIAASGCVAVHSYPILHGSKLHRSLHETPNRQTRDEFEASQSQFMQELVKAIKDSKGNITVNFNAGAETKSEPSRSEQKHWSGILKDLTESVKNLLLIGAAGIFLFDGMVATSKPAESSKPQEISIRQIDRDTQLKILPGILDASNPEDFQKAFEPLQITTPPKKPTMQPNKPRSRQR